ncbi:MAG: hypothetical protein JNK85_15800 [Verrucomicrobiales bacterium]|nr:hypothetical protein [Verrucomicrobiales bacterium]
MSDRPKAVDSYALVSALRDRRSRRFGLGMSMPTGPLAFSSRHAPAPISEDDEALLAWAACGITGPALGDLCYASGQGGNIMAGMVGRTVASGDCLQTVSLVVINDGGTWWLRRPHELPRQDLAEIAELNRRGEWTQSLRRSRVQLSDRRLQAPQEPIFNINANRWSLHATGSSYFLPIGDLTPMYLNGILEILNEDTGVYVLDERNGYRPAGLARFARSRGGHLDDDPAHGKVITIKQLEQFVTDFVNLEMGMVLQNLGLMTQALGLGGFPHFANHDFAWFQTLGFRCESLPASRYLGVGPVTRLGLRLLGKDQPVPLAVALEHNGERLLQALCPPNFSSMTAALQSIVDRKFGPRGVFRSHPAYGAWRDPSSVTAAVPALSDKAIAAAASYAEYVWGRYGRFPVHVPPFRCGLAHQVVHVDAEFYEKFYRPEALSETQHADFQKVTAGKIMP